MASGIKSEESSTSDSSAPPSGAWSISQITVSPRGYPTEILSKKSNIDHISCTLCCLIMKRPVQSTCGHRFCHDCIAYAIKQTVGDYKCPACVAEDAEETIISIDKIRPDTAIKKELNRTQVKCSFKSCDFSGKFTDYEVHYENEHVEVICPYGCNTTVSKSDLEQHIKENLPDHVSVILTRLDALESILKSSNSSNTSISESQVKALEQELKKLKEDVTNRSREFSSIRSSAATGGATLSDSDARNINDQLKIFEAVLMVFSREIERIGNTMTEVEESAKLKKQNFDSVARKLTATEQGQGRMQETVNGLARRVGVLESSSYDGTLLWKIDRVAHRRQNASSGQETSMYSPIFFTHNGGYQMRARLYLNGDGIGSKTHLSLFFVIMRGTHDAMLKWPFKRKVTMSVVDQNNPRQNRQDSFVADPASSSFQRPTTDMNVASGFPKFISLADLMADRNGFVKDDTMFIRIVVDSEDRP